LTKNRAIKINSFIKWGEREGYIQKPRLSEVLQFKAMSADGDREPFTSEELKKLFNPDTFLKATKKKAVHFWVPLIALFTGARLEEICQLFNTDIRQVDGFWCIDINSDSNEEGEIKRLKTKASKRLLPLHPVLSEELGLPRYAEEVRDAGETRLFPGLPRVRGKYSHGVRQWFGRYKKKLGFPAGKVFHSFRHTVSAQANEEGAPEVRTASVLGHKHSEMTYGHYGKRQLPPSLLFEEVISKLDFGVDLSLLKRSPHARPCEREEGFPVTPFRKEGSRRRSSAKGAGKRERQT